MKVVILRREIFYEVS